MLQGGKGNNEGGMWMCWERRERKGNGKGKRRGKGIKLKKKKRKRKRMRHNGNGCLREGRNKTKVVKIINVKQRGEILDMERQYHERIP